jgi:hypothetical protein
MRNGVAIESKRVHSMHGLADRLHPKMRRGALTSTTVQTSLHGTTENRRVAGICMAVKAINMNPASVFACSDEGRMTGSWNDWQFLQ